MTHVAFIAKYGEPDPDQTQEIEVGAPRNVTIYCNVEGGELLDMYQFSLDNGVLASKRPPNSPSVRATYSPAGGG